MTTNQYLLLMDMCVLIPQSQLYFEHNRVMSNLGGNARWNQTPRLNIRKMTEISHVKYFEVTS